MFFTYYFTQLFYPCHPFLPAGAVLHYFYVLLQFSFIFCIHFTVVEIEITIIIIVTITAIKRFLAFGVDQLCPQHALLSVGHTLVVTCLGGSDDFVDFGDFMLIHDFRDVFLQEVK